MAHPSDPLFDRHVIVDWSARNELSAKKPSADALWVGQARIDGSVVVEDAPRYFRGRLELMAWLRTILTEALISGERVFLGFDFAFGYPVGAAERIAGQPGWEAMWNKISRDVADDAANKTNRFHVANGWNRDCFGGHGPFWGHPPSAQFEHLPARKPSVGSHGLPEKRLVEECVVSAQPVWKLAYTGSVGSQALLGIKHLHALRGDGDLADQYAVWPFETGFDSDLSKPFLLAEVYPSLFAVAHRDGEIKDAAQVRCVAQQFAHLDVQGDFQRLLSAPPFITNEQAESVVREEGWIVGAGHDVPDRKIQFHDFETDPNEIYRQSFETVKAEASLDRFTQDERAIVTRMIHACGAVEIARNIEISGDAVECGVDALKAGMPVLCDVKMVQNGIIGRLLPAGNKTLCGLDFVQTAPSDTTRSAAGMEAMRDDWENSIVVVGNAPTALFQMLNRLKEGWPRPALIIGIPVGFVGAVESKAALSNDYAVNGVPYITLQGRMGGSAIASAALNGLSILAGDRHEG